MKNVMLSISVGCAMLMMLAACRAPATEELTGKVSVSKNMTGHITSITLTTDNKATYSVILDKEEEKLASLDGKRARVTYSFADQGANKIKVLLFSEEPASLDANWEERSKKESGTEGALPHESTPKVTPESTPHK